MISSKEEIMMLNTTRMKALALSAVLALSAIPAANAVDLKIGSGGEGGTYYPIVTEIGQFCGPDHGGSVNIQHNLGEDGKSVGGSVNNLRNLLNNKITAGIVQADVAHLQKGVNPAMGRIVALLPLHAEQVHVMVPTITTVMTKEAVEPAWNNAWRGAPAEYKEQSNPASVISDLREKRVAAWGGSVVTAKVINQLANIGFEVVKVKDRDEATAMITAGQVDAILATAGYPVQWIEKLPAEQYKLLSVTQRTRDALEAVYSVSGVSYDNMGVTGGQALETLAVDSLLMTRVYRTPEMRSALAELQDCVRQKIDSIKDTADTHPAWQDIDPSRPMKWERIFNEQQVTEG